MKQTKRYFSQFVFRLIFIAFIVAFNSSCFSSNGTSLKKADHRDLQYTSLIQILRGKPGLKITRTGDSYTVIIRGERSFFENNEPLYMLDDVVIGNTYREAASATEPSEIASAEVITPPNAGRFGGRGGNGVIVFRSKRKR